MDNIKMLTKKSEFQEKLNDLIDADMSLDEIITETDKVEDFFLTVKHARQMWHGAAYGKLTKNAEKTAYREKYGLKQNDAKNLAVAVAYMLTPPTKNMPPGTFLADQFSDLAPAHFRVTAPLLKIDFDKGVELLQKAQDEGLTRDKVQEECLEIRQAITLENRAQAIKENNQKMKIADARKKAADDDKKERLQKAAAAKQKAYEKAKEVIDEYESKPAIDGGDFVTQEEALAALKELFTQAAKTAHPDTGGSEGAMKAVNAANEKLQNFIGRF